MTTEKVLLDQIAAYRSNASNLSKEAFKVDTVLNMMNSCADTCELRYYETGISKEEPGVDCFKNCVSKAYKLSNSSFQ
jgi:hypothetical protein